MTEKELKEKIDKAIHKLMTECEANHSLWEKNEISDEDYENNYQRLKRHFNEVFICYCREYFGKEAMECVIPEFIKGECNCGENYRIGVNDCRSWIEDNIKQKFNLKDENAKPEITPIPDIRGM
jgi:hypothetical protein